MFVENLEKLGLAMPSDTENILLQLSLGDDAQNLVFTLEQIYEEISDRTFLDEIIAHDKIVFEKQEAEDGNFNSIEVQEFCYGIELGYEFVVGTFSYVHFLRSAEDVESFKYFLKTACSTPGEIPVQTEQEVARVKLVREGKAIMDIVQSKSFVSSKELSEVLLEDYLDSCLVMDTIVNAKLSRLAWDFAEAEDQNDDVEPGPNIVCLGFNHGVANALMMYLISKEEAVLQAISKFKSPEH